MTITKEHVNYFLSDSRISREANSWKETRPLFIVGLTEFRISAFLAWLLRPGEGHGLGDRAIRALLRAAWRSPSAEGDDVSRSFTPAMIERMNFSDVVVVPEFAVASDKGQGRIDVLLVSKNNNLVVAIENKFGSKQGIGQLKKYSVAVEQTFGGFKRLLVYLDAAADAAPEDSTWVTVDYSWLTDLLESEVMSKRLSEATAFTLQQFREYIQEKQGLELPAVGPAQSAFVAYMLEEHTEVFDYFRDLRKGLGRTDTAVAVANSVVSPIHGPLLREFLQNRQHWENILDIARHRLLVDKVRVAFDGKVQIGESNANVWFHLSDWDRFQNEESSTWGLYVQAYSGSAELGVPKSYQLSSGMNFKSLDDSYETSLRDAAKEMRSSNLRNVKTNAQCFRIKEPEEIERAKIADGVIAELKRMDSLLIKH